MRRYSPRLKNHICIQVYVSYSGAGAVPVGSVPPVSWWLCSLVREERTLKPSKQSFAAWPRATKTRPHLTTYRSVTSFIPPQLQLPLSRPQSALSALLIHILAPSSIRNWTFFSHSRLLLVGFVAMDQSIIRISKVRSHSQAMRGLFLHCIAGLLRG